VTGDDGNACTQTDACVAGACVGSSPVMCVASDDCHVPGTCQPATGTCTVVTAPDGTPCAGGICTAGVCTPNQPLTINYHQVGACSGFSTSSGVVSVSDFQAYVIFEIESIVNPGPGSFSFVPSRLFVQQATPDFFDPGLMLYPQVLAPNIGQATTVAPGQTLVLAPNGLGATVVTTTASDGASEANQTPYFLGYQAQASDPAVTLVKTDASRTSWPDTSDCRDISLM
jgi:hypothetical protein